MNNKRDRYGNTNSVLAAVDSETVIEQGDLVYQDVDDAKPASLQADQSSETANQELFAANFLGVAMQWSRCGETYPIRVATTGVFEFDCPSGTFELGDLIGPCPAKVLEIATSARREGLFNQLVAPVAASKLAIARVVKRVPTVATSVLIDIRSTVMGR